MRPLAIVLAVLVGSTGLTSLARAQGMPGPVAASIRTIDEECRQSGGTPGDRSGLVIAADLSGDGVRDWVINALDYRCDGGDNLYGGSRGGTVFVFAGTPDGGATGPDEFTTYGARSVDGQVLMSVAGTWCGQSVTAGTAAVDLQHCDRPIVWIGDHFEIGQAAGPASAGPAPSPKEKPGMTAPTSPRPFAAPANKPGQSGGAADPRGLTSAWLVGAWVGEGNACDSGVPVGLRADGTVMNELFSGTWRLDRDVLIMETRSHDDEGQPVGAANTARYRVEPLDENRSEWVPLEGGASHIALRCP